MRSVLWTARGCCCLRKLGTPRMVQFVHFTTDGVRQHPPKFKMMILYERILENHFPKAYWVHRIFYDGAQDCWHEGLTLIRVIRQLRSGKSLESFTREELQILIQTPKQMMKLVIFKILRTLIVIFPLVVFPLALALVISPRVLLSRHFWNPAQKAKYWSIVLKERRFGHYPAVVEHLRRLTGKVGLYQEILADAPLFFEDILKLKPIFEVDTFQFSSLSFWHQYHLCRSHAVLPFPGWIKRLERRARVLKEIDRKLATETLDTFTETELHYLDFEGLHRRDMEMLLTQWLHFSQEAGLDVPPTFMLHSPILFQVPNEEYTHGY